MFITKSLFVLLLTTIIHCDNITLRFPSYPVDTDIGPCTCDLTAGKCDVSCCCDLDCSTADKDAFGCSSRNNQYTNSTPVISTVQPSCIKNLSIFQSNSPYIIQKMGELVCVDYERYQGSQYYQKPIVQTVDTDAFVQTINTENSVFPSYQVPISPTYYEVGSPVLKGNTTGSAIIFSVPMGVFNSPFCSGSQSITYMNNFKSTCSQLVNSVTCIGALSPTTFNTLCLIQSPGGTTSICGNLGASLSNFTGSTCSGALKSLIVTIYYQNPTGIVNVNLSSTIDNANSSRFVQTYTVQFVQIGQSSSNNAGNPGYLQGATIAAGIANGSAVNLISSSQFSILNPSTDGSCGNDLSNRIPIRFGENVRSSCKYNVNSNCSNLPNVFLPLDSTNLYVAAYANSTPSNLTRDWLPVILCTSIIGTSDNPECRVANISAALTDRCYLRLNIQIAYTNIGSIFNPQPVLSAVIFYYQYQSNPGGSGIAGTVILTESVTFQDISKAAIVVQGQIPAPNTRLPANFLYPFSINQGTKFMTFSSFFSVFIAVLLIFL